MPDTHQSLQNHYREIFFDDFEFLLKLNLKEITKKFGHYDSSHLSGKKQVYIWKSKFTWFEIATRNHQCDSISITWANDPRFDQKITKINPFIETFFNLSQQLFGKDPTRLLEQLGNEKFYGDYDFGKSECVWTTSLLEISIWFENRRCTTIAIQYLANPLKEISNVY